MSSHVIKVKDGFKRPRSQPTQTETYTERVQGEGLHQVLDMTLPKGGKGDKNACNPVLGRNRVGSGLDHKFVKTSCPLSTSLR